jgi:hypothetical protein
MLILKYLRGLVAFVISTLVAIIRLVIQFMVIGVILFLGIFCLFTEEDRKRLDERLEFVEGLLDKQWEGTCWSIF